MSILLELFDKTAPWEYTSEEGEDYEITAQFMLEDNDGVEMIYEVQFVMEDDETGISNDHQFGRATPFQPNTGGVYDISFVSMVANSRFGVRALNITGGGNELMVFATVLEIIQTTTNKHNINNIVFNSSHREPSRTKLYNRMVRSMKNAWTVIPPKAVAAAYPHIQSSPNYDMWIMIKK